MASTHSVHAGATYVPDEMLVVLGFTVTIDNAGSGSDPDSAWETCSGGSLNIEVADASTGTDQSHQTTPGHKYVDTITLRGPLTSGRKDLLEWIATAVKASPKQGGSFTYDLLENGAGKFKIEIDGCSVASVNVESITVEDLVIDERELTTGADWDCRVVGKNGVRAGKITVNARQEGDGEGRATFECSRGQNIRKNISVIAKKRDGSEARRWNFFESFPTRWDPGEYSPSSTTRVETITCKMARVELA